MHWQEVDDEVSLAINGSGHRVTKRTQVGEGPEVCPKGQRPDRGREGHIKTLADEDQDRVLGAPRGPRRGRLGLSRLGGLRLLGSRLRKGSSRSSSSSKSSLGCRSG